MPSDMPTLGRSRKRPPRPAAIIVVILALFGVLWVWRAIHKKSPPPATTPTVASPPPTPAPGNPPPPAPVAAAANEDGGMAMPATPPKPARSAADEELEKAGLKRLRVEVNGPLETAVVKEVGPELGSRLTQVVVRSLVWWLSVPVDLRRGDLLEALYEERNGEDPVIHAVRYKSTKNARTYAAYLFKSSTSQWPRFYTPDGAELELRLQHAPLDDYEQVTSLLRDGRGHKGVDFKTPVGTPVKAPFDATVVKKNWNWKGNGNSIELHENGGHGWTALFLHLSEPPSPAVGAHVSRGDVVGKSGNTGHSFAPHLHYQLMSGTKVLDPFAVQETYRKKLPEKEKPALSAEMQRLDHLLDLK
jgi:murein DD-endopeptidase MepM/ murein hydrolase activator NlpD